MKEAEFSVRLLALLEEWLLVLVCLNDGQNYSSNFRAEHNVISFSHPTMSPSERTRFVPCMNRVFKMYSTAVGLRIVSSRKRQQGEEGCDFAVEVSGLQAWNPQGTERIQKAFRLQKFAREFIHEFTHVHLSLPENKPRFKTDFRVRSKSSEVVVFIVPVNGCVYPDPKLHERDVDSEVKYILTLPFAKGFAPVLRPRPKWGWPLRKGMQFKFKGE